MRFNCFVFWCICCHRGQWIWLRRLVSAFRKKMPAYDICDVLFTFGWNYVTGSNLINLVIIRRHYNLWQISLFFFCLRSLHLWLNHISTIVSYDRLASIRQTHVLGHSCDRLASYPRLFLWQMHSGSCMVRLRNMLRAQTVFKCVWAL